MRHWLRKLRQAFTQSASPRPPRRGRRPGLEELEARTLLSGSPFPVGLTPSQISHAYNFDAISFGGSKGNGAGQTIAIIDAYDDPNLTSDLATFDARFNLSAPPSFAQYDQLGHQLTATNRYGLTTNATWAGEEALDVEWAHALAPQANIVVVEANDVSLSNMMAAVSEARSLPQVTVVSMSFGVAENANPALGITSAQEQQYDPLFTTPANHVPITFLAATGDEGVGSQVGANGTGTAYQAAQWPACSPNVVAVGGTTLTLSGGNWAGETGWGDGARSYFDRVNHTGTGGGSGGGTSAFEPQPYYQFSPTGAVLYGPFLPVPHYRTTPDVAFDASPVTGVAVCDSFNNGAAAPWSPVAVGGTSFATPAWAALVAIADQGRAPFGQGSLDGVSQTLPRIYRMGGTNAFHDITTGNNGLQAGPGYDLVTGWGTPVANRVVAGLMGAYYTLNNGQLTVVGDPLVNESDTITLDSAGGGVTLTLNGAPTTQFAPGAITSIVVNCGPGTDTLYVQSTLPGVPVTLNGGTVNINPHDLGNIQGPVTVNGGTGSFALNVYDGGFLGNATYTVTASSVTRTGSAAINYNGTGRVELCSGSGNETINVESTGAADPVTIIPGNGTNVVNISPSAKNLGTIQGPVLVYGISPSSALNVDDQAYTGNATYTLSADGDFTVSRAGSAAISLGGGKMVLNGGSGNDTTNVVSTVVNESATINLGNGTNAVNVAARALVTVNGGTGSDTLYVNDQHAYSATYTLTGSGITVTNSTESYTVYYNGISGLVITGSANNDTFNVSSAPSFPVALTGGNGINTLNTAATLPAPVVTLIDASGGTGTVGPVTFHSIQIINGASVYSVAGKHFFVTNGQLTVVGDPLATTNDTFTLGSSGGGVVLTVDGQTTQFAPGTITSVVVNEGPGNDVANVESTLANVPVTINLGSGTDVVNISPSAHKLGNILGAVTVNGGSGAGTLNVNDQADTAATTYTLTGWSVTTGASAAIDFYNTGVVTVNGGSGADVYVVTPWAVLSVTNAGVALGFTAAVPAAAPANTVHLGSPVEINYGGAQNVFTVGDNGHLYCTTYSEGIRSVRDMGNPGVTITGTPSAINYGSSENVFVTGSDGNLYDRVWGGSAWIWMPMGNPGVKLTGTSSAITYGNIVHVFMIGADGNLYDRYFNGSAWSWVNTMSSLSVPCNPGVALTGTPSAFNNGSTTQVFVTGADGNLYDRYWIGGAWNWARMSNPGVKLTGTSSAITYGNSAHVFVIGADGNLYDRYSNGSAWSWVNTMSSLSVPCNPGVTLTGSPSAVVSGNTISVLVTGTDGNLYERYWSGAAWSWKPLSNPGVKLTGSPAAVLDVYGALDVFFIGANGSMHEWSSAGAGGWVS